MKPFGRMMQASGATDHYPRGGIFTFLLVRGLIGKGMARRGNHPPKKKPPVAEERAQPKPPVVVGGARPKPPATAAEGPRFAYGRRGVDAPCGNCARGVQDNGKVCMADMQDTGKIGTADTQGLDKIRAIPRRRYYGRPARLRR